MVDTIRALKMHHVYPTHRVARQHAYFDISQRKQSAQLHWHQAKHLPQRGARMWAGLQAGRQLGAVCSLSMVRPITAGTDLLLGTTQVRSRSAAKSSASRGMFNNVRQRYITDLGVLPFIARSMTDLATNLGAALFAVACTPGLVMGVLVGWLGMEAAGKKVDARDLAVGIKESLREVQARLNKVLAYCLVPLTALVCVAAGQLATLPKGTAAAAGMMMGCAVGILIAVRYAVVPSAGPQTPRASAEDQGLLREMHAQLYPLDRRGQLLREPVELPCGHFLDAADLRRAVKRFYRRQDKDLQAAKCELRCPDTACRASYFEAKDQLQRHDALRPMLADFHALCTDGLDGAKPEAVDAFCRLHMDSVRTLLRKREAVVPAKESPFVTPEPLRLAKLDVFLLCMFAINLGRRVL